MAEGDFNPINLLTAGLVTGLAVYILVSGASIGALFIKIPTIAWVVIGLIFLIWLFKKWKITIS